MSSARPSPRLLALRHTHLKARAEISPVLEFATPVPFQRWPRARLIESAPCASALPWRRIRMEPSATVLHGQRIRRRAGLLRHSAIFRRT